MCLAVLGKVVKISGKKIWVKYPKVSAPRPALLADEKVKIGDKVLVQMGIVVQIYPLRQNNAIALNCLKLL
jgi:hydrogenase maturation factor